MKAHPKMGVCVDGQLRDLAAYRNIGRAWWPASLFLQTAALSHLDRGGSWPDGCQQNHDYMDIDENLVWTVATEHLPVLVDLLVRLVPPATQA
jgi:hypothetical protein